MLCVGFKIAFVLVSLSLGQLGDGLNVFQGIYLVGVGWNEGSVGVALSLMGLTALVMQPWAGDWVDKLDELKTNINEQQVVAKAGAYALGRKTDELIISQLATSANFADADTDGLTKAKILTAFEMLGEVDVPDDGQCRLQRDEKDQFL